jgi:rubredoxin
MGSRAKSFDYYFCDNCRIYVYDEQHGDPQNGVQPNTPVRALPLTWRCPVCSSSVKNLRAVTLCDDISKLELARIYSQLKGKRAG